MEASHGGSMEVRYSILSGPGYGVGAEAASAGSVSLASTILHAWLTPMREATDGGGVVAADPLFTDVAGGDLTLAPGSPAIDAAEGSTATTDLLGNPRSGVPDIGAYERQQP